MRPITFPKTGPDEWTNRETGVRISRHYEGHYRIFTGGLPQTDATGINRSYASLAEARVAAKRYVQWSAREAIASAHAEALDEYAERNAKGGDESTIHFARSIGTAAECGLDLFTTAYTYGSPEWAEVTCTLCHIERKADR